MIKNFIIFILCVMCFSATAQVGIGTGTTAPNDKSMLDIVSSTKGVLIPRMTTAQRNAIAPATSTDVNAVNGLLIYNTDTDCYNYWSQDVSSWMTMCQTAGVCDPSTWSEFTIACTQFPAADANTYTIGVNTTGNTITVSVNVTKVGPYSVSIVSDNGVSYTNTGTFTTLGVQNVTVVSSGGAPSSTPINFSVKANGIQQCIYTKNATTTFAYSYTCNSTNPALTTFNFVQGSAVNSTFTIPLTVAGTGSIPSFTATNSGITLTTTAIPAATSANTTLNVTISGTPTASGNITVPLIINGIGCNYVFNVAQAFSYTYNCMGATFSSPTMAQGVPSSGTITVPVTVTGTGNIPAFTQSFNGVIYSYGGNTGATAGTNLITITYTGTPTSASTSLPLVSSNTANNCNITIVHPSIASVFTCTSAVIGGVYNVGYTVNSTNTLTLTLNATAGTYPAFSYNGGGVSFSSPAGTWTTGGTKVITLTATGTPVLPTGTIVLTPSNANICTPTINVTYGAAQFSCAATPAPAFAGTYNVDYPLDASNTLTTNLTVTVPGTYPSSTYIGGGMTFSNAGGTFTTTGNSPVVYTGAGTPTTFGANVLTATGTTAICPAIVNVGYGAAVVTCSNSVVAGSYIVETNLTANEKVTMDFTVSKRGNAVITSDDKNGIKFGLTRQFTTLGAVNGVVIPNVAAGFPNPQTSEESLPGGNGANNQTDTYLFYNNAVAMINSGATPAALGCPVTIDVKPKVITGAVISSSLADWNTVGYNANGASDSRIRLELSTKYYGFLNAQNGTSQFWNAPMRNISGASVTYDIDGSAYYDAYRLKLDNATLLNNALLGSIDPYNPFSTRANGDSLGDNGAHAGNYTGGQEVSEAGVVLQSGTKWYKYRLIFNTTSSGTSTYIILYGIYNTKPSIYVTKTTAAILFVTPAIKDQDTQSYWP